MRHITHLLLLFWLLLNSSAVLFACDNTKNWQGGLYLQPIAGEVVLNGKSIEMYFVVSSVCSIDCYKAYLDSRSIWAVKRGNIVSINNGRPGGVTLTLEPENTNGFTGKLVCLSRADFKRMNIPKNLSLPSPITDLQVTDKQGINRTISYKNISPVIHARIEQTLRTQAKIIENNGGFKYFVLQNGLEVYLTYDSKQSHVMTLVYNRRKVI